MLVRFGLILTISFALLPTVHAGPPAGKTSSAEEAELWSEVKSILDTRCMKCHDGPDSTAGKNLNGHAELVKKREERTGFEDNEWNYSPWHYVKPGNPNESLLYQLVSRNIMPLGETKLSIVEKLTIKTWIERGAPGPVEIAVRPFLGQVEEQKAVLAYLRTLPELERGFTRFFTFAPLHNNRTLHAEHLAFYKAGLVKLINGLSWQKEIVVPREVPGTYLSVLAIDLRTLGWDNPDAWTMILKQYPYAFSVEPELTEALKEMARTPLPVVRADWFAQAGSRPPLYHDILHLPPLLTELEKELGIDFEKNFREGNLARAGYHGASTTTSRFRVSERQEITKYPGSLWRSYDFGEGLSPGGRGNPLIYPLGPAMPGHPAPEKAFKHHGSEVIFNLPNGLQAYLVTDANGLRLDEPPTSVLKDKNEFSGTPALVNGISCMACHAQGMNSVTDQVLEEAVGKRFAPAQIDLIKKIYPAKEVMDGHLKKDKRRFLSALAKSANPFLPKEITVPEPRTEMTHALAAWYRQSVGAEEAARELGLASPAELKKLLQEAPKAVKGLGIKVSLLKEGGRVSRHEWERVFQDVVMALEAGEPISLVQLSVPREVGRGKKFKKFER